MTALLNVSNLSVNYGVVSAVSKFDIEVGAGEVVVVLGSNGAGKTSTLRAIAGLTKKRTGMVCLNGLNISSFPAHKVARSGLVLVPEGRRVFAPLTVEENLLIGGHTQRSRTTLNELLSEVYELFPRLRERRTGASGLLSGGEQQMLAFGRAIMASPKVMLLDEPSMGLAPNMVDAIMDSVAAIKKLGVGVLMVEQNSTMALRVAERAVVLRRGEVVLAEDAVKVRQNDSLMAALLGDVAAGRLGPL
jgi:branched-chain amino acid transport system ATP-binding protein